RRSWRSLTLIDGSIGTVFPRFPPSVLESPAHRNHMGVAEFQAFEEALALFADLVREQGDSLEIFSLCEGDHVVHQLGTVSLPTKVGMDDDVLQQNDEPPHGRADGEEDIDHSHDLIVRPNNKNASAVRLLQNGPEAAFLLLSVRMKI